MTVSSGGIPGGTSETPVAISKRYTCSGISPPLHWAHIPAGTKELVVGVLHLAKPAGLYVDWLVAGLKPSIHGLAAGQLPAGAIVARTSTGKVGYTVCPKGTKQTYGVLLYALPHKIPAVTGTAGRALAERAGNVDKTSALVVFN